MKMLCKLCFAIMKKNLGFTIGLLLLFTLSMAIFLLAISFPGSANTSLDKFIENYNMPDAWITTNVMADTEEDTLKNIKGIEKLSPRLAIDNDIEIRDKEYFSIRLFSMEDNNFMKYNFISSADDTDDIKEPKVYISSYFANSNNVKAGDTVKLKIPTGDKEVFIEAVVSCPETMQCVRNENQILDEETLFGHIYMQREDMDEIFKTSHMVNQWLIKFCKDVSDEERNAVLNRAEDVLGDNVISSTIYEKSKLKEEINSTIDILTTICYWLPGLIIIIAMLFSAMFIRQIINNQRKTIGLLRAIGYSKFQVFIIFSLYTTLIVIIAIVIGLLIGYFTSKELLYVYINRYGIPDLHYVYNPVSFILSILLVLILGIISCWFSIGKIANIDPREAYDDIVFTDATLPPNWIRNIKIGSFPKIILASVWRNKRRLFFSALCITFCIILMSDTLEVLISNKRPDEDVYVNRYHCDYIAGFSGTEDVIAKLYEIDGIKTAEPIVSVAEKLTFNNKEKDIVINAILPDASLITPKTSNGDDIHLKDGIVLDEMLAKELEASVGDYVIVNGMPLEITDIAREYIHCAAYMPIKTAERLGYNSVNQAAFSLDENKSFEDVYEDLIKIPGYSYNVSLARSKEGAFDKLNLTQNIMIAFMIFAFLIGTIMVYNMVVTEVKERTYEYATLLSLGTENSKFCFISLFENLVRCIISILVSIPLSVIIAQMLFDVMSSSYKQYVMVNMEEVILTSSMRTFLYVVIGVIFTLIKIRKFNLPYILNSKE